MTFGQQVRWSRKWGVLLAAAILPVLGLWAVLPAPLPERAEAVISVVILLLLTAAAALLVMGGVARPLQKAIYHRFSEDWPLYRRIAAMQPLRFWLWLTPQGRDRDG